MSNSDRQPYLTATVLDQTLLDNSHDNLVNEFDMIVDIETPDPGEVLHLSDKNKYVGQGTGGDPGIFYEARIKFPIIKRALPEFLNPKIKFSTITIEINNADGKFNRILPSGDDYGGWIGKKVTVKIGLRDITSSYFPIFEGTVSPQGGLQRTTKSFILQARSKFEELNNTFPTVVFDPVTYPDIEPNYDNVLKPYIYGDWTISTSVEPGAASVPAFPVNGNDPNVNGETTNNTNVQVVISENANTLFDNTEVYIRRADTFYKFDTADIVPTGSQNNSFQVRQSLTSPAATTMVEGALFTFKKGDTFLVKVKGKDLGSGGIYDQNIIEQAKDLLTVFGGATAGDFATEWGTLRDKASPPQSNIFAIRSRIHAQDPIGTMDFVLSLLAQVRVEAYVNRDQDLGLNTLHFEDWESAPAFTARNWDYERPTMKPKIDDRTNINRAKAAFNFLPNRKENFQETAIQKNVDAINQSGVEVSKLIVFPNLYVPTDVKNQLIETIRLSSSTPENIFVNASWRHLLLDIGDFVLLRVSINGTIYDEVPCLIREIGYDPNGIKIPLRLWSMQMTPFPGYTPGYSGTVGGYNRTITQE